MFHVTMICLCNWYALDVYKGHYYIQQLMLKELIYSRKAAIDQSMDGLCVLNFNELIQQFPVQFEPLLVSCAGGSPTPDSLIEMLQASCSTEERHQTFLFLKQYVNSLNPEGKNSFIIIRTQDFVQSPFPQRHNHFILTYTPFKCVGCITIFSGSDSHCSGVG